jgi:hypothetical protein
MIQAVRLVAAHVTDRSIPDGWGETCGFTALQCRVRVSTHGISLSSSRNVAFVALVCHKTMNVRTMIAHILS